jgi:hypothetical protein
LAVGYHIYLHLFDYEKYGVWLVLATVLSFAQLGNPSIGQAVMKLVAAAVRGLFCSYDYCMKEAINE